ncbi:MAG: hypothetical protein ACWGQW_02845 [bacterium]
MKNTLKNRLILFVVAYGVSFVVARIYRNKVLLPQAMAEQEMWLNYHLNKGDLKVIS